MLAFLFLRTVYYRTDTTATARRRVAIRRKISCNLCLTRSQQRAHDPAMNENITWQQRINDLVDAKLTIGEIAQLIGIKPPGLCDIRSGKTSEPKGAVAVKLYKLHLRRCKRAA